MASPGFLGGFRKGRAAEPAAAAQEDAGPAAIPPRVFVPAGAPLPLRLGNALADHAVPDGLESMPPIEIVAAPALVDGSPIVHCIGDSLTNRLMPALDAALRAQGLSPDYVGTMEQAGGFLGEARDGKMAGQYALAFPGMAPVPPGGEAAYLELPNADRLNRNPYATLDAGGEPRIDIAGYFERFQLDVPDYVVIALGTNDTKIRPASAVELVERLLDAIIPQFLALGPQVRIGLLHHVIRRADEAAERRWRIHLAIIRAAIARAGAEPRVEVIPSYLHQSATEGWPERIEEDGRTGIELVHFGEANARVAAAATAAWIAAHEAARVEPAAVPASAASRRSTLSRPLNEEDVHTLFRLLLGRAPESEAAVERNTGISAATLIEAFLTSEEYRRRLPGDVAERVRADFPGGRVAIGASPEQLDALVERTRETWATLGSDQPYWSVLTNDIFRGERISRTLERSFFDSGRDELAAFEAACVRNGIALPVEGIVVDLGCGVGRVGLHLAQRFCGYVGVDISEPHLQLAARKLAEAGIDQATWSTLDTFIEAPPAFECFFSLMTLQHSPPPIACALLDLLMGQLNRGGIGYFQLPHALYDYHYAVEEHLAQPNAVGEMEIHAVAQRDVFGIARAADCDVIEALPDGKIGASGLSTTYLVRKR